MPNKDGTGPEKKGPRTGRGLGKCAPEKSSEEDKSRGEGRGGRKGQGRNRGNKA